MLSHDESSTSDTQNRGEGNTIVAVGTGTVCSHHSLSRDTLLIHENAVSEEREVFSRTIFPPLILSDSFLVS